MNKIIKIAVDAMGGDNSPNIEYLVKYFENYRLNLKNNTLNYYINGVLKQ